MLVLPWRRLPLAFEKTVFVLNYPFSGQTSSVLHSGGNYGGFEGRGAFNMTRRFAVEVGDFEGGSRPQ